jgi:hypothetical protein
MKSSAKAPDPERASGRMENADAIKEIRGIFDRYLATKRELCPDLDRIVLKGWPDRTSAVRALSRLASLVMECEILRFEYLLNQVPLESPIWTSLRTITQKLFPDWDASDEKILSDTNAAYRETVKKLEAAERSQNPAELDGPLKDARRDPEWKKAWESFHKSNDELDRQFIALRAKWPEPLNR